MKLTLILNDEIDLTSRWKVRFRQTFFQNEAQKVLYKPVLVSDLIIHFWWSYSLSNFFPLKRVLKNVAVRRVREG